MAKEENRRLYHVIDTETNAEFLVNAGTKSSSISHKARTRFKAAVAKTKDVARLVAAGVKVEEAGSEPADEAES